MFWFFEKLRSFFAWAAFHVAAWIIVPGVVMLLCLFRVKLPDQMEPKPDTQDAVALQDEMSGVRR